VEYYIIFFLFFAIVEQSATMASSKRLAEAMLYDDFDDRDDKDNNDEDEKHGVGNNHDGHLGRRSIPRPPQ
jgi:hypothetical protein